MKKTFLLLIAFLVFCSHDMFLKLDTYFLQANSPATINLFNGTFEKSENVIARDRMIDMSLISNGLRTQLDTTQWTEKDSITVLSFNTGAEGTYVAGVSTKPRNIEMDAEAFNSYLEHDGVIDMIEWRKSNNAMDQKAVEKYSKHVKTIVQVGNKKTGDWETALGYPIEFVPLSNPYELFTGDKIQVQLLANGEPLANQLVYVDFQAPANGHTHGPVPTTNDDHGHSSEDGHVHDNGANDDHEHGDSEDHSHGDEAAHEHGNEGHTHLTGSQIRTNEDGIVSVHLVSDGIWYLRTINLQLSEEKGLTHESNWATLTFEVGHSHGSSTEAHVHEEETPFGIPSYAYWLGSFALIGILFFWFYRKN